MLKALVLCLLLLIVSCTVTIGTVTGLPVPLVQCSVADSPVTIDGDLGDSAWNAAPVLGPFVTVNGDHYPSAQTEVRVLRSDKALLFAVRVFEPNMDKILAKVTERDKGAWTDDAIELFLKPGAGPDYYQLIVNSLGVQEDSKNRDTAWNGIWQSASGVFPGGWTVEVAIPFETLGVSARNGESITFNVCRERQTAREFTAWANPGGNFHFTSRFGEMLFVDKPSFIWAIQTPEAIHSATSKLAMKASGLTATYPLSINTYNAGKVVEQKSSEFKCIAGESHKLQLPFTVPGTEQPGVEVVIKDTKGAFIMRSGVLPLEITDASQYELGRVEVLLSKVKKAKLPPRLAGRTAGWQMRMNQLRKEPILASLRTLGQELSAALLVAALPSASRSSNIAIPFVFPVFKVTDYTTIPAAKSVNQPVKITACRGEYEPASLHLLALEDLKNVSLKVEDLHSGKHILRSKAIDVKLVKNWFQAGIDSLVGQSAVFVPELLLTDDSIITPDYEKQRDTFNFDLAVGPEMPAKLKPFDIPAFTNRQWWLLAHIPENQAPGFYKGKLTITANGKLLSKVPFQVTVLPEKLEETDGLFSMYYYSKYTMGKDPRKDANYELELSMCKRYGMSSLYILEGGSVKTVGDKLQVDASEVRKALELRMKYGLTGDTQYMGYHWYVPVDGVADRIWLMNSEQLAKKDDPTIQAFLAYCREIEKIREELKFPGRIDIYTHDEPGYDPTGNRMAESRMLNDYVHSLGLTVAQAITRDGARKLGNNLDLPILSDEGLMLGERKAPEGMPTPQHYYHPLENPISDRLLTGLATWYNGYRGAAPYAFADGGGWDDWKNPTYRPENYAYSGKNGPIPTIQFEGYREGVDDYKYLEMINRRVIALEGMKLTKLQNKVFAEAKQLLSIAPLPFRGAFNDLEKKVTVEDFAAMRARCQKLLLQLDRIRKLK
jgi:hypothetical protein